MDKVALAHTPTESSEEACHLERALALDHRCYNAHMPAGWLRLYIYIRLRDKLFVRFSVKVEKVVRNLKLSIFPR